LRSLGRHAESLRGASEQKKGHLDKESTKWPWRMLRTSPFLEDPSLGDNTAFCAKSIQRCRVSTWKWIGKVGKGLSFLQPCPASWVTHILFVSLHLELWVSVEHVAW
jgi:hypothetical protein